MFRCLLAVLNGRALLIAAVPAWRLPELAFECTTEGRFRFVPDVSGNIRDASRRSLERSGSQLKPPSGEIGHGWLGEISGEAVHQSRSRNAHFVREVRDRPGMGDAAMQESETSPDDRIARARQAIPVVVPASQRHNGAGCRRTAPPKVWPAWLRCRPALTPIPPRGE